jgi:hypothetical protein
MADALKNLRRFPVRLAHLLGLGPMGIRTELASRFTRLSPPLVKAADDEDMKDKREGETDEEYKSRKAQGEGRRRSRARPQRPAQAQGQGQVEGRRRGRRARIVPRRRGRG